jgi:hypothetical protein
MLAKRWVLFLLGCMGARLGLAYAAKTASTKTLRYLGCAALVPALGFALIYAMGWRKTGAEVFNEKIWWDGLRPVHAALYLIFAVTAIRGVRSAWTALLLDALIGLVAFLYVRTR